MTDSDIPEFDFNIEVKHFVFTGYPNAPRRPIFQSTEEWDRTKEHIYVRNEDDNVYEANMLQLLQVDRRQPAQAHGVIVQDGEGYKAYDKVWFMAQKLERRLAQQTEVDVLVLRNQTVVRIPLSHVVWVPHEEFGDTVVTFLGPLGSEGRLAVVQKTDVYELPRLDRLVPQKDVFMESERRKELFGILRDAHQAYAAYLSEEDAPYDLLDYGGAFASPSQPAHQGWQTNPPSLAFVHAQNMEGQEPSMHEEISWALADHMSWSVGPVECGDGTVGEFGYMNHPHVGPSSYTTGMVSPLPSEAYNRPYQPSCPSAADPFAQGTWPYMAPYMAQYPADWGFAPPPETQQWNFR